MPARQLTFDLAHRPSLSGEDFLIAPANVQAITWIDTWPNWPSQVMAISGPAQSGKTHLAHVFMAMSNAHLIDAADINQDMARNLVEGNSALVIDNADSIAGSAREEVLFHILKVE